MKIPKITPGPWETDGKNFHKGEIAVLYGGLEGDCIEIWSATCPDELEQEANAIAIAALPDLINALIMVLDDPHALDGRPRTAEAVISALLKAGCTEA